MSGIFVLKQEIVVGARVQVKPSVMRPYYGWGRVTHDCIGVVSSVGETDAHVKFPRKKWLTSASEEAEHKQKLSEEFEKLRDWKVKKSELQVALEEQKDVEEGQRQQALFEQRAAALWEQRVAAAVHRYRGMCDVLSELNAREGFSFKMSRRTFVEFEEECDWLKVAEEIVRESAAERKGPFHSRSTQSRRRSVFNCLKSAHEGQPPRTLKRSFSCPLLKRTCQLDMSASAPFSHECGDLLKWSTAVINRNHTAGGHYVEAGGSLTQKKIGAFVDSGLNASLAPSGKAQLFAQAEKTPVTWKTVGKNRHKDLPPLRNRTARF